MPKILIVEDEVAAANRMKKMVLEAAPDAIILEVTDSISSTVQWLSENQAPDLIFMDIHLADGLSFKIFEQVTIKTPVIFTTAFDNYAIQAFKVNSIDYLLKPIKKEELDFALQKFRELEQKSEPVNFEELVKAIRLQHGQQYRQRFLVGFADKLKAIEVQEIAYFEADNKSLFIVTHQGKRYDINSTLEKLEPTLDPNHFFRANRKYIICFQSIEAMHNYSKSRIKITLNPPSSEDCIVSTERSALFKEWLNR
jgi:two-component system response regulator LytT